MTLLAGIDEAGYGPHLGPLVVSAAALEFPGRALPEPDLWKSLKAYVSKRPARDDRRVLICDSKVAYGGAGDLAALERAVLGFLAAMGQRPRSFVELLAAVAVHSDAAADGAGDPLHQPWHRPEAVVLPVSAAAGEIEAAAVRLTAGLASIGGMAAGLWINVASAARLNRLIDGDRNKAAALFTLTVDLLAQVQARSPREPIHVAMDRHGGRRYYAGLLSGAFPMTPVVRVEESPAMSRYRLLRGPPPAAGAEGDAAHAPVDLTVRDRCEAWSLPTALASMAAKYVRELHMIQLNAYFASLVPGLKPTAGYGRDAWRFLGDVASARAAAGVPDAAILRNR